MAKICYSTTMGYHIFMLFGLLVLVKTMQWPPNNWMFTKQQNSALKNGALLPISTPRVQDVSFCSLHCFSNGYCTVFAVSKITNKCILFIDEFSTTSHIESNHGWDVYQGIITNVALQKPTSQSSNKNPASRAVDGVWNSHSLRHHSCSETYTNNKPWWQVDLGSIFAVHSVTMLNRGECCGDRLSNIVVTVGITTHEMYVCAVHEPAVTQGGKLKLICQSGIIAGRYVKIQLMKTDRLTLCEVSVRCRTF